MDRNTILEPVKEFNSYYKNAIIENAEIMFDSLAVEAKVSEPVNQEIIKRLRKAEEHLANQTKKRNSIRGWRTFLTIVLILCGISAIFTIYAAATHMEGMNFGGLIAGAVISILLIVGGIVFDIIYIKKRLKHFEKLINDATIKVNNIRNEAYEQMSPLFSMFDWTLTLKLVNQTCPLIKLDQIFDVRKLDFLITNYGFQPISYQDADHSIINVISGTMSDNPFLIVKQMSHRQGTKTYTGSIINTYTEWEGYGDDRRLVTKTETLVASVTKPYPYYDTFNYIVYGNEAAGKLVFNRFPSGLDKDATEKQIARMVKKGDKKLDKLEQKALTDKDDSTNFQKMGNEKFDVLFGATDRNNEVEFRMLFTPSVQLNMTNLIVDGLYGDDFTFNKRNCINIIYSQHSQGFDYSCSYTNYVDIEYKECKRKFVEYNSKFFDYLYFDLAPLLAITLYQATKPRLFTYKDFYKRKYTSYEDESMANNIGYQNFGGPGFDTQAILKSKFLKNQGETDYSIITSHSFTRIPMVDIIPVYGRDGLYHDVPVHYDIYEPITKDTVIGLAKYIGTEREFASNKQNAAFQDFLGRIGSSGIIKNRGLLGFIVGNPGEISTDFDLNSLIDKK